MSHQSHTDPEVVSGALVERKDGMIVLGIPETEYEVHLVADDSVKPDINGNVRGKITAQARRLDIIKAGGIFIEPSWGRPRHLQGRVIKTDVANNTVTIEVVVPFICKLDELQKASQFPIGALVSFDVKRGARFEPA